VIAGFHQFVGLDDVFEGEGLVEAGDGAWVQRGQTSESSSSRMVRFSSACAGASSSR